MPNPDDYIQGTFDERNPANQQETEPVLIEVEEEYFYELQSISKKYYKLLAEIKSKQNKIHLLDYVSDNSPF